MQQEVFNVYRSETQMLRYLHRLQKRDLSLADSMIPLGSCTMKVRLIHSVSLSSLLLMSYNSQLNAVSEMLPVSWPEFAHIHPFAPASQWVGYDEVMRSLSQELAVITGFAAVSCQPNVGSPSSPVSSLLSVSSTSMLYPDIPCKIVSSLEPKANTLV